ncbi:hypothetical protein KY285_007141 [Solanum tuberosum]|nr:hypothetical protein KY285_007141 [Solanum tuberosum]
MDNNPLNQHFLDEELVDIEKSKESWIFQHLENEVMDDEFEKVDELEFNEICQSLENEVLETNKIHISALIQSLEDEGMVNSEFRNVYLLKKETPSFFRNLVCDFFHDARTVIYNLTTTLESSSVVNFDFLKNHCFKLKGSSACIGACTLVNGCSIFIEAVENKSKNECLEAIRNMNQAYHELDTKLKSLMKVEKEIVAAEERAFRQQQ